jgi:anti-sigma regulatory factor (Ser/Thr protein kinase)
VLADDSPATSQPAGPGVERANNRRLQARVLAGTLEHVLAGAQSRYQQQALEGLTHLEAQLDVQNDPALVPELVCHLQDYLSWLKWCDKQGLARVGIALEEAITNGIFHGNLELSSELRQDGGDAFERLAQKRRRELPYCARQLHITAKVSCFEAVYVIRDEGPGFDPSTLPDPTDPTNLERVSGRGLLLIRTFMDAVSYNAAGNEITLVKRR